ncbi:MAG: hypothetical protein CMJ83_08385 [Planctomycetes bacterium]|nr:hypothetical protein [Planctomycetota bacterium]
MRISLSLLVGVLALSSASGQIWDYGPPITGSLKAKLAADLARLDIDAAFARGPAFGEVIDSLAINVAAGVEQENAEAHRKMLAAYVRMFPFASPKVAGGSFGMSLVVESWLLLDPGPKTGTPFSEIWGQLGELDDEFALAEKLATELVTRGPKWPPLALAILYPSRSLDSADTRMTVRFLEKLLAVVKRTDAPPSVRITLLWGLAQLCGGHINGYWESTDPRTPEEELLDHDDWVRRKALPYRKRGQEAYLEIAKAARNPAEADAARLAAGRIATRRGDDAGNGTARRILGELIINSPKSWTVAEARHLIIQSFTSQSRPVDALKALRGFEKTANGADLSRELFTVARGFFSTDKKKALLHLQEITTRWPRGLAAPLAWVGLGETYVGLGRTDDAVAAYIAATKATPVSTHLSLMDAGNTQGMAYQWLGRHFAGAGEWMEAARWWIAWKPSSWSGTSLRNMERHRQRQIDRCLKELDATEDGDVLLEIVMNNHGGTDRRLASKLVRLIKTKDARAALRKKLAGVIATTPDNGLATTLEELLRIRHYRESRDVAALFAMLDRDPQPWLSPTCRDARSALDGMRDELIPFATARLTDPGVDGLWATLLLAACGRPATWPAIERRLQKAKGSRLELLVTAALQCGAGGAEAWLDKVRQADEHDPRREALEAAEATRNR